MKFARKLWRGCTPHARANVQVALARAIGEAHQKEHDASRRWSLQPADRERLKEATEELRALRLARDILEGLGR